MILLSKNIAGNGLVVIGLAGWLNRRQQAVIGYLIEENPVLKDQFEGQRRRLALKASGAVACLRLARQQQ